MIAGIVITNTLEASGLRLDMRPVKAGGEIALNLFLAISLMSTPLVSVAAVVGPLTINVIVQIAVIVAVAYFILFLPMIVVIAYRPEGLFGRSRA